MTKGVASSLGYTRAAMLGEMAATVWDTLLPEPFCQLHRVHAANELPLSTPSFSCRSGLSVCLLANTPQGPEVKPFKLKVEARKQEGAESVNVVTLKNSCMEEVRAAAAGAAQPL